MSSKLQGKGSIRSSFSFELSALSRQLDPHPHPLACPPGLGIAAAARVGVIPVEDFRQMAEAAGLHQPDAAREPGQGRLAPRLAVGHGPGLAVRRERPGPGGAVVVSRLAAGVLIPGVVAPIGPVGVVEQVAAEMHRQRVTDGSVGQAADGAGDEQFLARAQDLPAMLVWRRPHPG